MIQQLYKVIEDYQPMGEQEIQDQKVMLDYIRLFDNILTRENAFAHMTSSPWIVNEDFTKVLLIYHRIYDSWGWCGGHCDGEEDLLEVAVKEGREETGLTSIRPLSKELMALDILPVPPHKKRGKFVSSHVHLNATFFCMADYRFFWSMIKKKSRHTSFYLQNSNLPFDMRSNDSWPAHDSFPMILENRNKLDVDGYCFPRFPSGSKIWRLRV